MKGKLITFEGCEGCGKSTQIQMLKEYLERTNQKFVITREPGGTKISEKIRSIILDKDNSEMGADCEALLYAASRCQLLNEVILPTLESGTNVFIDRYFDSSFAYQASARELGYDFIENINRFAIQQATPDITIFFDLEPYKAFMRKGGADKEDRIEISGYMFHEMVYLGYKDLMGMYPERFVKIDAFDDPQTIHNNVLKVLREKGFIQ